MFAGHSIDIVDEWLVVDNVVGQQVKKVLYAVVHRNNEKKMLCLHASLSQEVGRNLNYSLIICRENVNVHVHVLS